MHLQEHVDAIGATLAEFADAHGFSYDKVRRWSAGESFPRPGDLLQIERVTARSVTASDMAKHFVQVQGTKSVPVSAAG